MVDDCRQAIDTQLITLVIGIDQTRAFDIINIGLLVEKLRFLGLSDSVCNWFTSFLSGRSQSVVLSNGETSSPLERSSGVPQGSILGPPCFSLFINDLPSVLDHCKYCLYADDLVVYLSEPASEVNGLIENMNSDLANIARWVTSNGLVMNAKKLKQRGLAQEAF